MTATTLALLALAAMVVHALLVLCAPRSSTRSSSWRALRTKPGGWRNWLKVALTGAE